MSGSAASLAGLGALVPQPASGGDGIRVKPEGGKSFAGVLAEKLSDLDGLQRQAESLILRSVQGNEVDPASVMLALEEANLSLQLAVQVRNKLIEAYQEISRMQV